MPDEYKCPHGCITTYPITTLRGWKRHMTVKHGRFTEAELQAAASGAIADDVQSRMTDFAASLDSGTPVEIRTDGAVTEKGTQDEGKTAPLPAVEAKRKVRATPKRLTQVLAGIPEKILEALAVTPDKEDREALQEAADFLQDVFGFDFEVDESKTTIRSRWWAFLWVGGIMALVYVKHKGASLFQLTAQEIPPEEGKTS